MPQSPLGKLPLAFEANHGQAGADVRFLARAGAAEVRLEASGVSLSTTARLSFPGSRRMEPVGEDPLQGKVNYLAGKDPRGHLINIPTWRAVRYRGIYPGIDMVYYGSQSGQLEYDFIVAPGADPSSIRVAVASGDGSTPARLTANADGSLSVSGGGNGHVRMHPPKLYQDTPSGRRLEVAGSYRRVSNAEVAFEVGQYNRALALVVDPVITFSTNLAAGGSGSFSAVAAGPAGAYLAGRSQGRAWVVRLNGSGTTVLYSTILGEACCDSRAAAIAVDSNGFAYIAGSTEDPGFPTVAAFQPSKNSLRDGFVAKLSPDGASLVYSTFLGGSGYDYVRAIAVDSAGRAHVTGDTTSINFPRLNALQNTLRGTRDAFVSQFTASGSALLYSTYLGGSGQDAGAGLAVDTAGNVSIAGNTTSSDFPVTPNASQPSSGGADDAFVTSLNATGSALRFSTFLGGQSRDIATSIALDGAGNPHVGGYSGSPNFPVTAGAAQTVLNPGAEDAFAVKMDGTGNLSQILYSTLAGGSNADYGKAIAVDAAGNVYLAGETYSPDFPAVRALQSFGGGSSDQFVLKVRPASGPFLYSSYLGGNGGESIEGVALGQPNGSIWLAGFAASSAGSVTGTVTKLAAQSNLRVTNTSLPDSLPPGTPFTNIIGLTNLGPDVATKVVLTAPRPAGTTIGAISTSQGTCTAGTAVVCNLGAVPVSGTALITVQLTASVPAIITSTASVTSFEADPVPANNSATATTTVRTSLTVSVSVQGGTGGSVRSGPVGINCGTDCSESYTAPTVVTLLPLPSGANSRFVSWSGACSGSGGCMVTMNQSRAVTARFGPLI